MAAAAPQQSFAPRTDCKDAVVPPLLISPTIRPMGLLNLWVCFFPTRSPEAMGLLSTQTTQPQGVTSGWLQRLLVHVKMLQLAGFHLLLSQFQGPEAPHLLFFFFSSFWDTGDQLTGGLAFMPFCKQVIFLTIFWNAFLRRLLPKASHASLHDQHSCLMTASMRPGQESLSKVITCAPRLMTRLHYSHNSRITCTATLILQNFVTEGGKIHTNYIIAQAKVKIIPSVPSPNQILLIESYSINRQTIPLGLDRSLLSCLFSFSYST